MYRRMLWTDVIVHVKCSDGGGFFIIPHDLVYSEVWIHCSDYVIWLKKPKKNPMLSFAVVLIRHLLKKRLNFF